MSAIIEAELVSSPMLVPRESDLPPLTFKQANFVKYYIETRNATKSAEMAGYEGEQYTLAQVGAENLRKPSIQAHLQHALKSRQIGPDEVLAELSDIAIAPWKHFVQVKLGPNNEVIDAQLKLTDKIKSLDILSDLLGMKQKPDETSTDAAKELLVDVFSALFEKYREQSIKAISPASTDS